MKERGILVVVSGPSGVGKGTICKQLLKWYNGIKVSVSATTRVPRAGEVDGKNYHFISKAEFERMIENDEFIEYAKVYDNYYGTPRRFVEERIQNGEDVLLEIDIQGAMQVKDKFPEGTFIFILPPSLEELKTRIIGRGSETVESFNARFGECMNEIRRVKDYDYFIINDVLNLAAERLYAIIEAEKCEVRDDVDVLIGEYEEEKKCFIHQSTNL
jgi:guanylate kinase